MPDTHETAYPRLKSSFSDKELHEFYTPSADELAHASEVTKGTGPKICFLILLKTFQRLGYFVFLQNVPKPIAEHISLLFGVHHGALEWAAYDESGTRRRHVSAIRDYLGVKPFDTVAQELAEVTFREIAHTREDLTDLINPAIEELVRQRYELPAFRTLVDAARRIRTEINRQCYHSVYVALGKQCRQTIDDLLLTDGANRRSLWQSIKLDPGAPTLKEFRHMVERLKWLKSLHLHEPRLFATIPPVKVRHIAQEAASLDAARMLEMEEEKCCTLVAALVQQQVAHCLDDLGEMIVRRMRKAHARARQALADHLWQNQPDTDQLIGVLSELLQTWQRTADQQAKIAAFDQLIGGDRTESLLAACQAHAVHANRNYRPFLWPFHQNHRQTLFAILAEIELRSTLPEDSLCQALSFLLTQRKSRQEWLSISLPDDDENNQTAPKLSLDWIPDKWRSINSSKNSRSFFGSSFTSRVSSQICRARGGHAGITAESVPEQQASQKP